MCMCVFVCIYVCVRVCVCVCINILKYVLHSKKCTFNTNIMMYLDNIKLLITLI